MPTWLSPRVRLGVTASVIIVILCTLLLTADRSDNDSSPSSVTTPDNESPPASATEPSSSGTPMPALPQAVITALNLGQPLDSATDALPGTAAPATDLAGLTQDVLAPLLDRDVSTDLAALSPETLSGVQDASAGFGDLVLAQPGIHLNWTGCTECEPEGPTSLVPWGGITLPGGGGGESGVVSLLTQSGNPSPVVIPPFVEPLPPGGNPPGGNPPGGDPDPPEEPRPKLPVVPVPEPSTVTLAGAALGLVIGGARGRKRTSQSLCP